MVGSLGFAYGYTLKLRIDGIQESRRMRSGKGRVKAVLFDLGGTLVRIDNSEIPRAMKRALEDCGINRSLDDVSQAWVKSWEELNFRDLTRLLHEFWVQWSVRVLSNLRVNSNDRLLARFVATRWWSYSKVNLYPDAEKVLPRLKEKGLKTGLITNGLQRDINEMLSKVGLQGFFDVVVVVDTLRKMKPDVEVFHYALEKLGTAPSEAVFVGDEVETDYKGAQKCGLTAFLIDRDSKSQDKSVNKISSLEDLFKPNNEK
jgi:2-haloalkanoic acid dehalogenase type II